MSWNCGKRLSISARARWAGLGWAWATRQRRHAYHSHTSFGLRRNAPGVARSSGRNFAHRPVCVSRKVGTPLSAETPAPVRTVTFFAEPRQTINWSEIVIRRPLAFPSFELGQRLFQCRDNPNATPLLQQLHRQSLEPTLGFPVNPLYSTFSL